MLLILLLAQDLGPALEIVKRGNGDLALWTLTRRGVSEKDPALQRLFREALEKPIDSTSAAALRSMSAQDLDPFRYRAFITRCAQMVVDTQCKDGRWGAGRAVEDVDVPPLPARGGLGKFVLKRRFEGPETGDVVNFRWGTWALLAAHNAGIAAPEEVVAKALRAWREEKGDPAAALSGLCACLSMQGKNWKQDPDVVRAFERLAALTPTEPEGIYVLNRAMELSGWDVETWRQRDTNRLLASRKPDGGWGGLEATCYAALSIYRRP